MFGAAVLVALVVASVIGMVSFQERVGSPTRWTAQKWEAFKTDDTAGVEQSRYLSASGSGRYILWQVAWEDFASHPILGIGTHNCEATYYQLRENSAGYARQPHMLPLEVPSERALFQYRKAQDLNPIDPDLKKRVEQLEEKAPG